MLANETENFLSPQTDTPVAKRQILIVDDDPQQAEVLAYRLGEQGFRTITAHRGEDALHIARSSHPQLILLDLRLPDVDGLSVCHRLTEQPATCGIPVIILSGMERPDIIRRAREAGCEYFLRKPYDPSALLVLVEHTLSEAFE